MFAWFRKFRISNRLDADGVAPTAPSERSGSLKQYSDSMARVDAALKADIDSTRVKPSRDLRRRTIEALQATTLEEPAPASMWRWPRLVGAVAAIAVVAAVTVNIMTRPTDTTKDGGRSLSPIAKLTEMRPSKLGNRVPASDLLMAEAKGLLADVRQAKDRMVDLSPLRTAGGQWAFTPSSGRQ